ncbi:MAG: YdbL family protein [Pseudomonadota bacterium]
MIKQLISALVISVALLAAGAASAADLQAAKQQGLIGERADGFLGLVVDSAPADVQDLVRSVNAKRRAEYQRIAGSNDLTLEQVQALAGKKAIERTQPGGWVMENGGWQQK